MCFNMCAAVLLPLFFMAVVCSVFLCHCSELLSVLLCLYSLQKLDNSHFKEKKKEQFDLPLRYFHLHVQCVMSRPVLVETSFYSITLWNVLCVCVCCCDKYFWGSAPQATESYLRPTGWTQRISLNDTWNSRSWSGGTQLSSVAHKVPIYCQAAGWDIASFINCPQKPTLQCLQ